MMKGLTPVAALTAGLSMLLGFRVDAQQAQQRQQSEVHITVGGTPHEPTVIGIPGLVADASDVELSAAARVVSGVLWDDIDFEVIGPDDAVRLVSKEAATGLPVTSAIDAQPYDRWQLLGADAILVGRVQRGASGFSVDVSLIGVRGPVRGRVLGDFAQNYKGCMFASARACAHDIADDFHKRVTQ